MPADPRRFARRLLALCLCAGTMPVMAATADAIAYVPTDFGNVQAYLIEWQSATRANLTSNLGVRGGSVARAGAQRVITLDAPFSEEFVGAQADACGDQPLQRQDTLQVAVNTLSGNDRRGTSSIVTLGTLTNLSGCEIGKVVPFGALTDPGLSTRQLALALRPAVTDLVPGVSLAGLSEQPKVDPFPAADVLTLQAGGQGLFAGSGNVVPAALNAENWLVLTLPFGQRAYARLSVDRRTGAETWLDSEWAAGVPTNVRQALVVKPLPGAGFGTVRQAARQWASGLSNQGGVPSFFFHLYGDGSGARVAIDLATGAEVSRQPITWAFNGPNIEQRRPLGGGTGVRTWKPLANVGRVRFVMEDEVRVDPVTGTSVFIKPRVNVLTDVGAATPPAAR